MALEFGIWDHFERQPGIPISQQYEQRIELIFAAEEYGFAGYHVAEHHLTPLDLAPSPTVFLSAVAQRTSRIRDITHAEAMHSLHLYATEIMPALAEAGLGVIAGGSLP